MKKLFAVLIMLSILFSFAPQTNWAAEPKLSRPDDKVKVTEFLKMVIETRFTEFPEENYKGWEDFYIKFAKDYELIQKGEINAYNRYIKKYEMVRIIVRFAEGGIYKENLYKPNMYEYASQIKDFDILPYEQQEYIVKAYANGILFISDNYLKYSDLMTRKDAYNMVQRLADRKKRVVPVLKPVTNDIYGPGYKLYKNRLYYYDSSYKNKYLDVSANSTLYTPIELTDLFKYIYSNVKGTKRYLRVHYNSQVVKALSFTIYPTFYEYGKDASISASIFFDIYLDKNDPITKKTGKYMGINFANITFKDSTIIKTNINDYLPIIRNAMKKVLKTRYSENQYSILSQYIIKESNNYTNRDVLIKKKINGLIITISNQDKYRTIAYISEK